MGVATICHSGFLLLIRYGYGVCNFLLFYTMEGLLEGREALLCSGDFLELSTSPERQVHL